MQREKRFNRVKERIGYPIESSQEIKVLSPPMTYPIHHSTEVQEVKEEIDKKRLKNKIRKKIDL